MPSISIAVLIKDGSHIKNSVSFTAIGTGSQCLQKGIEQYRSAVSWTEFFHGCSVNVPHSVLRGRLAQHVKLITVMR